MSEATISNSALTRTEAQQVLNGPGKLTFHPQGRNKFRCNQIPRIRNVGKKKIFSLKSQLTAYARNIGRNRSFVQKNATVKDLKKSYIDMDGDVRCTKCKWWNFLVWPGKMSCAKCGEKFIAVR